MLRLTKKRKQALQQKQELLDLISGRRLTEYYQSELDKYHIHTTCYWLVYFNIELTWENLCKDNDYYYKLPRDINKINWNYQKKYDVNLVKQYAQMQKEFIEVVKVLEPYYCVSYRSIQTHPSLSLTE